MMGDEWLFPNRATPVGSSAYYSVRFAPASLRHDLAALLAWRHELRAIPQDVSDPGVARLKLQWWREELERAYRDAPRHPLSRILAPVLARRALPRDPFSQMSDQVEAEILRRHPADQAGMHLACEQDQGALFELMAHCHDAREVDALTACRRLGTFCARVYKIRDSGLLARRGRILFPLDSLRRHGLSAEALMERAHRAQLPMLLREAAEQARDELPTRQDGPKPPAAIRVWTVVVEALLNELERSGFAVADQRIELNPLRKLWIGWRECRRV
jgi:phytoene synthase